MPHELRALRVLHAQLRGAGAGRDGWVLRVPATRAALPRLLGDRICARLGLRGPQRIGQHPDTFMFSTAQPRDPTNQSWHRDSTDPMWVLAVPLVDFDPTNGATQVLPHSEKTLPTAWARHKKQMQQATGQAGDAYAFSGQLLHRRAANLSAAARPILLIEVT